MNQSFFFSKVSCVDQLVVGDFVASIMKVFNELFLFFSVGATPSLVSILNDYLISGHCYQVPSALPKSKLQ